MRSVTPRTPRSRVYYLATSGEPAIMVTVKAPGGIDPPQRLRSVRYQRPDAHLKHLGTEQGQRSRRARRDGFDDALLIADDETVSESSTANIGFLLHVPMPAARLKSLLDAYAAVSWDAL